MSYPTLMVNLAPGLDNAGLLGVAGDLADRFHARVIGIAAGQLVTNIYADGYVSGSLINQDRADVERAIEAAETEFRHALHNRSSSIEWRSTITFGSPAHYVAAEARSADLVIIGTSPNAMPSVNTGDLIMNAGRPVLTIPHGVDALLADEVVIAWKDTREARRAVTDALPLLRHARQTYVVEVASDDDLADAKIRTRDVADWLGRHNVAADPIVSSSANGHEDRLREIVREHKAGLVVAGAYGHSRMREWMLGGVTRGLLSGTTACCLLSH